MAPKINLKVKVEDGEMDLNLCGLQEVPVKEIATYKKVHTLDLSNNHLITLPKTFGSLTHLIKLDLSKNKLKQLPDNFGDLVKLKHLDLYKNELQHLPLTFWKLKSLRWLDLKDNPLVPAIKEVATQCIDNKQCQKCAKDIVQFYTTLQEKVEHERQVREVQRQKAKTVQQNNNQKKVQEKKKKLQKKKVNNGPLSVTNSEKGHNLKPTDKKVNNNKTTFYSLVKYSFLLLVILMISLSATSAFGSVMATSVLSNLSDFWHEQLNKLPVYLQPYGKHVEFVIIECHKLISISTKNIIDHIGKSKNTEWFNCFTDNICKAYNIVMDKFYNLCKIVVTG